MLGKRKRDKFVSFSENLKLKVKNVFYVLLP